MKEKPVAIEDGFDEDVVGFYKKNFFLYSKMMPDKLIIRNFETFSCVGEIILPDEMVKLIKKQELTEKKGNMRLS